MVTFVHVVQPAGSAIYDNNSTIKESEFRTLEDMSVILDDFQRFQLDPPQLGCRLFFLLESPPRITGLEPHRKEQVLEPERFKRSLTGTFSIFWNRNPAPARKPFEATCNDFCETPNTSGT